MLRKIQLAAATAAAFFGTIALYDALALPTIRHTTDPPWPGMEIVWGLPSWVFFLGAIALMVVPFAALVAVARSCRAAQAQQQHRLDLWRRVTWSLSIVLIFRAPGWWGEVFIEVILAGLI